MRTCSSAETIEKLLLECEKKGLACICFLFLGFWHCCVFLFLHFHPAQTFKMIQQIFHPGNNSMQCIKQLLQISTWARLVYLAETSHQILWKHECKAEQNFMKAWIEVSLTSCLLLCWAKQWWPRSSSGQNAAVWRSRSPWRASWCCCTPPGLSYSQWLRSPHCLVVWAHCWTQPMWHQSMGSSLYSKSPIDPYLDRIAGWSKNCNSKLTCLHACMQDFCW